jgi:hypothetical protein
MADQADEWMQLTSTTGSDFSSRREEVDQKRKEKSWIEKGSVFIYGRKIDRFVH